VRALENGPKAGWLRSSTVPSHPSGRQVQRVDSSEIAFQGGRVGSPSKRRRSEQAVLLEARVTVRGRRDPEDSGPVGRDPNRRCKWNT